MVRIIKTSCTSSDNLQIQLKSVLKIKEELESIKPKDDIILDMSNLTWISPTYIVPLMVILHDIKEKMNPINLKIKYPYKDSVYQYLKKIHFPGGIELKRVTHHNTVFPLVKITEERDETILDKVHHIIQKHYPKHINAIALPLQELTDNVYQHAKTCKSFLMAQHYPQKEFMDVCIADNGIGIKQSYMDNNIKVNDDIDAVKKAYRGLSTKRESTRGFGIFHASTIPTKCCDGQFILLSNTGGLHIYNKGCDIEPFSCRPAHTWNGTLAIGRFKLNKAPKDIYSYLER